MILFIISIFLVIIGIIFYDDWFDFVGSLSLVLGIVAVGVCCLFFVGSHSSRGVERRTENLLYEKSVLEYRLERQENNLVGNELLYNDIVKFNKQVNIGKRNLHNPWVNWMTDRVWENEEITYIEIPDLNYNFNNLNK